MAPKGSKHVRRALGWVQGIKTAGQMLVGKEAGRAINKRVVGSITGESFKKGGKVHKTGLAKVHAGEVVLTAAQAKSLKKVLK